VYRLAGDTEDGAVALHEAAIVLQAEIPFVMTLIFFGTSISLTGVFPNVSRSIWANLGIQIETGYIKAKLTKCGFSFYILF